jgi:hypothetical protein
LQDRTGAGPAARKSEIAISSVASGKPAAAGTSRSSRSASPAPFRPLFGDITQGLPIAGASDRVPQWQRHPPVRRLIELEDRFHFDLLPVMEHDVNAIAEFPRQGRQVPTRARDAQIIAPVLVTRVLVKVDAMR